MATRLPSVDVDSFNIELKDEDGFLGDRACKGAFRKILDSLRKPLKDKGDDPLGKKASRRLSAVAPVSPLAWIRTDCPCSGRRPKIHQNSCSL